MPPLFRLPRAFHAMSLATTSIASRTPFVVCVPIASATPSSLQGRIGFTNALRATTALSVPHSVADGCVPTPSGSCGLRHGHLPYELARFTPIPSVSHCIITSSHLHLPPRLRLVRLSQGDARNFITSTHFRVARLQRRSCCQRANPRFAVSPAQLGASVIRGCSCHIRRTERQWIKMQTDCGLPRQAADLP